MKRRTKKMADLARRAEELAEAESGKRAPEATPGSLEAVNENPALGKKRRSTRVSRKTEGSAQDAKENAAKRAKKAASRKSDVENQLVFPSRLQERVVELEREVAELERQLVEEKAKHTAHVEKVKKHDAGIREKMLIWLGDRKLLEKEIRELKQQLEAAMRQAPQGAGGQAATAPVKIDAQPAAEEPAAAAQVPASHMDSM